MLFYSRYGFPLNDFVSPFNGIYSVLLGFAIIYSFNYLVMTMILIMTVMFMMIVIAPSVTVVCLFFYIGHLLYHWLTSSL